MREFGNSLPSSLNGKQIHEKLLQFMASHGIRQHGEPRIGIFAERVHPDPCTVKLTHGRTSQI